MHDTLVKMKDGRTFCGPIAMFRPKEGWFSVIDERSPEQIPFREVASAVTKDQRCRVGQAGIGDEDELERARQQGWDGT
jgi:hypothetical protein